MADPVARLRARLVLGLGRGLALCLLQPVHLAACDLAAAVGRGVADGDPRRRLDTDRADSGRGHHHAGEERRLDLFRALEFAARRHLRRRHPVHAVRTGARPAATLAALARAQETGARMTPALEVTGLSKRFGGLPATKDVSLTVM